MSAGSVGGKSLLLTVGNWSASLLGMLIAILVARRLGPDALGAIGYGTGLVGLAMAALLPGFGQAHLKRLSEGLDAGRCLGTMIAAQSALILALVPPFAIAWAVGAFGPDAEVRRVFALLLAAQMASRFADAHLAVFLAREWVVQHAAIVIGVRVVRLLVTVLVLAWAPNVTAVAATFAIDGVLGTATAAAALRLRHGIRLRAPTRASVQSYWTFARPLLVTTPLALFQDSIDRVVVGRFGGLAAAGHYHVARALWEALASVMAAPAMFLFTRLSAIYAQRGRDVADEARSFFFGGLDKLLFISVPLALGFWALGEWFIRLLYGAAFAPAAPALRVLILATLVANVVNPYTLLLFARDEVARFVPVNVLRVVVYVAALLVLVPETPIAGGIGGWIGGATGAAVCRLFLILFPAWVYFRWTRDLLAIPLYPRVWLYAAAFGAAVVAERTLVGIGAAVDAGPIVTILAAAGASLAIYGGAIALAHPEAGAHFSYALSMVSPGGLRNSVRGERSIR